MITSEEIASIAKQAFAGENVEIVDHRMGSHSKDKVGFLGDHQHLELTVRRNDRNNGSIRGQDTDLESRLQLFVKALPQVSESQSKFLDERGIFAHEALYFNHLLPLLRESFVGEDWCPKCFLANEKILVLEDMRERGFAMLDGKTFDREHLHAALRAQARLHAASLLVQPRLGKFPVDLCPEALDEKLYCEEMREQIGLYADFAEQVAQRLGLDHRRIFTALERGFELLLRAKDYQGKLSPVVCHGDSWSNNYIFDRSQPPRAVMVDYQLARYAPRMFDVAQIIYISMAADVRRRELRKAIEAYHEELCDTLERNNPELKRPSLEDLLEEYEHIKLGIFLACIIYYPIVLMSNKELGKYIEDPELLYKRIVFRENNQYTMELYEQDNEFASRLNELVTELVDYCQKCDIPFKQDCK